MPRHVNLKVVSHNKRQVSPHQVRQRIIRRHHTNLNLISLNISQKRMTFVAPPSISSLPISNIRNQTHSRNYRNHSASPTANRRSTHTTPHDLNISRTHSRTQNHHHHRNIHVAVSSSLQNNTRPGTTIPTGTSTCASSKIEHHDSSTVDSPETLQTDTAKRSNVPNQSDITAIPS